MSCCNKKDQCCQSVNACSDYLVCTCMSVMKSDIVKAIHNGADTFSALSDQLGVGTGCSTCTEMVRKILEQETKK